MIEFAENRFINRKRRFAKGDLTKQAIKIGSTVVLAGFVTYQSYEIHQLQNNLHETDETRGKIAKATAIMAKVEMEQEMVDKKFNELLLMQRKLEL